MEVKTGAEFVWVDKLSGEKILVNINHITKIEKGSDHVIIHLTVGKFIYAAYTMESIAHILPIRNKVYSATL